MLRLLIKKLFRRDIRTNSMYKSRNISKKIQIPPVVKHPLIGHVQNCEDALKMVQSKVDIYLGDTISSEDISPESMGRDNIFSSCDLSFDKSSSSSISWAEENDSERTNLVQQEYERMESVLQGLEDIPPYYDCDEYELWINTFPCLR